MFEAQLRAIVETAVDGIILIDRDGLVTLFNPACERLFGYAAAEVIGSNVKMLMPEPYHGEHDGYLENYRRSGVRKIIGIGREVVGRRKNGETFPMELSVGEAEFEGDTLFVGILRDISDRREAEAVRQRLIQSLSAVNEEQSRFANAASHDLREPLRMVSAFCGLLQDHYGGQLDDRGREFLALAVSGARQMGELLDDLLAYTRLDVEERARWFEAPDSLDLVIDILGPAIATSGAVISQDALPRLYGNPIRFQRLMQNLLANAIKYVGDGVRPRIHVSAVRDGAYWRFCVADNGIGVAARHHEQIFEPFKRLRPRGRQGGTGLGLAISRKIVEGFGGCIWVEPGPDRGSRFVFTLKADGPDATAD